MADKNIYNIYNFYSDSSSDDPLPSLSSSENYEPDYEIVQIITYITATLGILGSLFIIVTFCAFREARSLGTRLVFFLSLADLVHSFEWYPWGKSDVLCITQGIIMQWSELSYYFWCLCIAFCIFQIHYLGREEHDISSLMPVYLICCWFIPLAIALIPLYAGHYGRGRYNWCWIQDSEPYSKAFLIIPCLVVFVINSIIYITVHIKITKYKSDFTRKVSSNMLLYMLAFLIAQAFAVINRIQNAMEPTNTISSLFILQAIFHPLQGFLDGVAYGANEPAFTTNYKMLLIKWGCISNNMWASDGFAPINYGSFAPSIPTAEYNYDYEESVASIRGKLIVA